MKEIWRKIPSLKGKYRVSNLGNVRHHESDINRKLTLNKKFNYYSVYIYFEGNYFLRKVHRLVGEAFIPNPKNKPQINHKDGNRLNNNVKNLEWNTALENVHHAMRTGLMKIRYKLSEQDVRKILQGKKDGIFARDLAKQFNTTRHYVRKIWDGTKRKEVSRF